ncbi:hypothetical protein CTRG_03981 [Candida tropicalis MYA-3404]|uniref:Mitochondrial thiamine pyrophosphate carrier 1 n=1 Tax=Candida tropicalis (strain ATCC MYA-3404 / T1) TaxID=294747 RepID=C5MCN0_CANTT|nr:hypothetical protein CTRG_03981 [Candida tropicalis MYA-3404]EER32310.1 hypothetical protein CTRG_03981 [Candida tropicalis MYA-3404]KAG4405915.1 hypothetical protein JTP64_004786 [Candida tropicalis]
MLENKPSASLGGDSLLTALISATTASAFAATVTYPFDFIKTQQQLNNEKVLKKWDIPGNYPTSIAQMYKGASALVLGSVVKNATRVIAYNWSTRFMSIDTKNNSNKTTAPRIVVAGVMSGFIETLWIIPFENVKITMIQNQTLANELNRCTALGYDITGRITHGSHGHHKPTKPIYLRQYVSPHAYLSEEVINQYLTQKVKFGGVSARNKPFEALKVQYNKHPSLTLFGTVKEMYELKGIRAFTAGTFITFVRQIGVSWVWLATYNATRQLINPNSASNDWFGGKHTMIQSVGLHFLSSMAVIMVTQPLDVIKTHLQSKNGKQLYHDSLNTAYRLFLRQGPWSLFKGALPRFLKVLVSGSVTATVYEYVERLVTVAGSQQIFRES